MSRALDKTLKAALKQGDHRVVYDAISSVLSTRGEDLWEIEFLGESHSVENQPLLRDGNDLAITKIGLLQAFLVAREIFFKNQHSLEHADLDKVRQATAVMLLMDPEHLTAANVRKRVLLLAAQKEDQGRAKLENLFQMEKYLVDSLLTSRLHRHTKSPNLWNHKRWLLEQFQTRNIPIDVKDELTRVVLVSGERHPKNYYAWMHARDLIYRQAPSTGDELILATKKWCYKHHNDISGWMFLLFLLERWPGEMEEFIGEVLSLAIAFGWKNESVWYFLRNLVMGGTGMAMKQEVIKVAGELLEDTEAASKDHRILRMVLDKMGTANG